MLNLYFRLETIFVHFYIFATKQSCFRYTTERNKFMANKYFQAILALFAFFVTNTSLAQGPPPPPPPVSPIDGGLAALFALGIGYAVKKIHDHSKK
jgi:hypothetical protein